MRSFPLMALALVASSPQGATAFSNLTSGGRYDGGSGWSIGANFPGGFSGGGACFLATATNDVVLSVYGQNALSPIGGDASLDGTEQCVRHGERHAASVLSGGRVVLMRVAVPDPATGAIWGRLLNAQGHGVRDQYDSRAGAQWGRAGAGGIRYARQMVAAMMRSVCGFSGK